MRVKIMITFAEKETEPVDSSLYRQIKPDCHFMVAAMPLCSNIC